MNVYDFDGTIYHPDASVGFAFWCMNRHPSMWFTFFPKALKYVILYKKGKMTRCAMMRKFFSFLKDIDDFDTQIERFWDKHEKNISAWYLAQKKPDDLILTASPSCIIKPIAKRLGVQYAATEYDREFGVFVDNLMFAKGKARYMIDRGFPVIENFYSDSLADTPIALCAEKAHFVTEKAQKVNDWPHLDAETMKEVRRKIGTGWTIHI
ncbi:MAG: haloacid dehalogenase-like hydrolase [Clostridium sp.]|nr:haloacid dehalogenase-like hydrolase [Clostridium sp.]